jgi:hypothetical protein
MSINLPFDVARCACRGNCHLRDNCARYTSPGRPVYQTMIDPSKTITDGENCKFFIDDQGGAV